MKNIMLWNLFQVQDTKMNKNTSAFIFHLSTLVQPKISSAIILITVTFDLSYKGKAFEIVISH